MVKEAPAELRKPGANEAWLPSTVLFKTSSCPEFAMPPEALPMFPLMVQRSINPTPDVETPPNAIAIPSPLL